MAETDILNPPDWRDREDIGFNPNPSYGFTRKSGMTRQLQRPRMGRFYSRDVANAGHMFSLQWIGIPLETVQRIRQFYHSFKNGYFTLIDVDNAGRNYVGRFTSEPEVNHTENGKYNIQGLVFEEMPQARMLQYPSDFVNDGHTINVVDDDLNPLVAFMQGTWITQVSPAAPAGSTISVPSAIEGFDADAAAGDWAQIGYVGWGFQMTLRLASTLGICNIYLDGVELVTQLNLVTGACATSAAPAALNVNAASALGPASVTIAACNVPLDLHRVKLVVDATSPAGQSMIFTPVEYIY